VRLWAPKGEPPKVAKPAKLPKQGTPGKKWDCEPPKATNPAKPPTQGPPGPGCKTSPKECIKIGKNREERETVSPQRLPNLRNRDPPKFAISLLLWRPPPWRGRRISSNPQMERKVFPGFSRSMKSFLPKSFGQFHIYSAMVHLGCRSVEGTFHQAKTIWFDDFPGESHQHSPSSQFRSSSSGPTKRNDLRSFLRGGLGNQSLGTKKTAVFWISKMDEQSIEWNDNFKAFTHKNGDFP
jgi:hypothetical protein